MGEHRQGLRRREAGADAGPRAGAERDILEPVTLRLALGPEAVGVEAVRILPQPLVAVEELGPQRDDVARRHRLLTEPVRAGRLAVHARGGRVEAKRLLEHPAEQRQTIGKAGVVDARRQRRPGLLGRALLPFRLLESRNRLQAIALAVVSWPAR
jgi:hypothetical protein